VLPHRFIDHLLLQFAHATLPLKVDDPI
jgi:hypothetical protein